jgi:hypothetical protein
MKWLAYSTMMIVMAGSMTAGMAQPRDISPEDKSKAREELDYFDREGRRNGLSQIRIDTRIEFPRVIVTGFRANLGSGTVTGTGRVDLFNPLGRQQMKVAYRNVPLAFFVRSYLVRWDADISGTIDADLDLTWSGITRNGAKRTMSGTGVVRYSGGTIRQASAVAEAGRLAGIARPLPQPLHRGIARGTMSMGNLTIQELRIQGPNGAAEARGTVGLSTGIADTRFQLFGSRSVVTKPGRGSGASWAGSAGQVRFPVAITITGNLDFPQVRVVPSGSP